MKKIKKLSYPIYSILINQNLDRFTVTQARDALQKSVNCFDNENDARKYVYRQINQLVSSGYLKTVGNGRAKLYMKTEAFNLSSFSVKVVKKFQCRAMKLEKEAQNSQAKIYIETLKHECIQYRRELSIILAEMQEYNRLMNRFPDKKELLISIYTQANERSEVVTGKINALTNALNIEQKRV